MTTQTACAGALSGDSGGWHGIDWTNCHREVRRLQARIVKATQEGRWGKVKALQWLLTHSFSGKALAVRRVTENQGKKTPGVDKVVWDTPEKKENALDELRRHGYKARPLRRVYIPKSNGKLRPLGIPTMRDRAMQALHLLGLLPVSETQADGCSYGFRPERSVADAVDRCFRALNGQHSAQWILEADIKGCFDHISHDWLLGNVPMDKRMLEMWLRCGFMEAGAWSGTEAGTPQGGIISPTLANMALDGLEHLLGQSFRSRMRDRKITNPKVNLVRYADDFVITGDSEKLLVEEVKPLVEQFLVERGLTLSAEKTKVTHIDDGFDFLGQNVRKYNGKLLIKPSAASLKACADKIRTIIRSNKAANQASLIHLLNPVIQGWANFHRHIVSKRTFKSLDDHVWRALWKWALRRHPAKGKKWIRHRYFHAQRGRQWVFAARYVDPSSKEARWATLRKAVDTKIRRHTMIRMGANPFDPEWEAYFEQRLGAKMKDNLQGRKRLLHLWLEQDGKCPVCDESLTKESGWHVHHIVRRVDGGSNHRGNLVMVHPNCHYQIHNLGLQVVKPAPAMGL